MGGQEQILAYYLTNNRCFDKFENRDIAILEDDIWEGLNKAAIVVCDLSRKKANVFYETGIAHTLGKDVILIAQAKEDIPFDIAVDKSGNTYVTGTVGTIKYDTNGNQLWSENHSWWGARV